MAGGRHPHLRLVDSAKSTHSTDLEDKCLEMFKLPVVPFQPKKKANDTNCGSLPSLDSSLFDDISRDVSKQDHLRMNNSTGSNNHL